MMGCTKEEWKGNIFTRTIRTNIKTFIIYDKEYNSVIDHNTESIYMKKQNTTNPLQKLRRN